MISFSTARKKKSGRHLERRLSLIRRIEAQRGLIKRLLITAPGEDGTFHARLLSLLLHADGHDLRDIIRSTGLSQTTIRRVLRRYELWGISCVSNLRVHQSTPFLKTPHNPTI